MRKRIPMTNDEKAAYDIASHIREYGESTNENNYGFADSFYTITKIKENGEMADLIKFKGHSFRNLLDIDAPKDIVSKKEDKLLIAFHIGLVGGKPSWNVPA